MIRYNVRCYVVVFLLSYASSVFATIIRVPSQYPTIQQGLNAAGNGDTVLVAANTYFENITWPNVDGIRLMSESGPGATIIDASGSGRVITFPSYSFSRSTIISGFTIQNGASDRGAGIYTYGSPYLIGNVIQRNIAQGTSTWVYGGGMFCDGSGSPRIEANEFSANVCQGEYWNHGGGLYIDDGVSPLVVGNVFEYDSTVGGYWNYGSGIYCDFNSSPDIRHNILHANVATGGDRGYGAGIHVYSDCPAYILSNLIINNTAQSGSWNYGAGIHINNMAVIYNNTIAGNMCIGGFSNRGGGIHVYDSTNTIANNIVVGNSASSGGGIGGPTNAHATLMNNDVWNNSGGNYFTIPPGANDISQDPLFVAGPLGDYYLSQIAAGQAQNSPCLDYGFTTADSLELSTFTTRTDSVYDQGIVDLGYHYPIEPYVPSWDKRGYHRILKPNAKLHVLPTFSSSHFRIEVIPSSSTEISLIIVDEAGRKQETIYQGTFLQENTYLWNGREYPAGVYFVIMETGNAILSQKVILVK